MLNLNDYDAIHTGLKSDAAFNAISGVLGQLADGWGENNPRNDKYWQAAEVMRAEDGETMILISKHYYVHGVRNGFAGMTYNQIFKKFAAWIEKTAKFEYKDCGKTRQWRPDNTEFVHEYFHGFLMAAEAYEIAARLSNNAAMLQKVERRCRPPAKAA